MSAFHMSEGWAIPPALPDLMARIHRRPVSSPAFASGSEAPFIVLAVVHIVRASGRSPHGGDPLS